MEFARVVARRRMVRRYRPEPVDPAVVDRILDAARAGPSAGFSQGESFVVVTDPDDRAAIARLCGEAQWVARGFEPWLSRAPVHVVPCVRQADYHARYARPDKAHSAGPAGWHVPWWWVDGGAALMLLLLATVDEGLGAGLLDVGDPGPLRRLLAIPADVAPLGLVTIGHPAAGDPGPARRRPRRPRGEVVHVGRWGA
ncbi:MAG: nitroreductase family protein [Actinomycetota bacterium]|nr:nitroreductase family protein [Actinomycetota bacterium]